MIASAPTPVLVVDLLSLIGADTTLHAKTRYEYEGPCPKCHGTNRFNVNITKGWWGCRKCTPKGGDAITYKRWMTGCTYQEALKALGAVETRPAPPPAPTEPTADDRTAFERIALHTHARLTSAAALSWLAHRGITEEDAALWRLGIAGGPSGAKTPVAGRNVWCGLTIPLWGVDGALYGIQVRRSRQPEPWDTTRDWRYVQVYGSHMPLYGQPPRHPVCLLVEGAFDCMLMHRIAGDLVDVAAVGSDRRDVADRWYRYLNRHTRWLIGHDWDEAGEVAAAAWLTKPRATRAVLPLVRSGGYVVKDPTEVWQGIAAEQGTAAADGVLRGWVEGMIDAP